MSKLYLGKFGHGKAHALARARMQEALLNVNNCITFAGTYGEACAHDLARHHAETVLEQLGIMTQIESESRSEQMRLAGLEVAS